MFGSTFNPDSSSSACVLRLCSRSMEVCGCVSDPLLCASTASKEGEGAQYCSSSASQAEGWAEELLRLLSRSTAGMSGVASAGRDMLQMATRREWGERGGEEGEEEEAASGEMDRAVGGRGGKGGENDARCRGTGRVGGGCGLRARMPLTKVPSVSARSPSGSISLMGRSWRAGFFDSAAAVWEPPARGELAGGCVARGWEEEEGLAAAA